MGLSLTFIYVPTHTLSAPVSPSLRHTKIQAESNPAMPQRTHAICTHNGDMRQFKKDKVDGFYGMAEQIQNI